MLSTSYAEEERAHARERGGESARAREREQYTICIMHVCKCAGIVSSTCGSSGSKVGGVKLTE